MAPRRLWRLLGHRGHGSASRCLRARGAHRGSGDGARALNPAVAVAADGRAIAAFQTADAAARPRRYRVAMATAPPAAAFRSPITVSASGAGPPAPAIDSEGRAVVAWVRAGAIEAASVSADGRPGRVRRFAAGNHPTHPIVAIAPRGHALIAWTSAAPVGAGVRDIRVVRRLGTRRFSDPETLAVSPKGTFTVSLAATVLDQGRPVVVWSQIVSGAASPSAPPSHRSAAGAVWMATMRPSGQDATIRRLSSGGDDVTGAPALASRRPTGSWPRGLIISTTPMPAGCAATADLAARFGEPTTIGPLVTSDSDILSAHTVAFSARTPTLDGPVDTGLPRDLAVLGSATLAPEHRGTCGASLTGTAHGRRGQRESTRVVNRMRLRRAPATHRLPRGPRRGVLRRLAGRGNDVPLELTSHDR